MEAVKHSGFEAPAIGIPVPDGTTWRKNPDGTISPIYPENSKEQDDQEEQ